MALSEQATPAAWHSQVTEDSVPDELMVLLGDGGLPRVGHGQHQHPSADDPGQALRGRQVVGNDGQMDDIPLAHRAWSRSVRARA